VTTLSPVSVLLVRDLEARLQYDLGRRRAGLARALTSGSPEGGAEALLWELREIALASISLSELHASVQPADDREESG